MFRAVKERLSPDLRIHTVSGNHVEMVHDSQNALERMLSLIAQAKNEVLLEMYWFASDAVGRRFADALINCTERGVRVRVIYDAVGSWESDETMFSAMRAAGCLVYDYHPVAPWRRHFDLGLLNERDHRKILVIDGGVGIIGGVNIAQPWMSYRQGGENWRDDVVQVSGPAVAQMSAVFFHTWNKICLAEHRNTEVERLSHVDRHSAQKDEQDCSVAVLANKYRVRRRAIRRAYLQRIFKAKKYMYIANAYLCQIVLCAKR